jgi:hypothetical protein
VEWIGVQGAPIIYVLDDNFSRLLFTARLPIINYHPTYKYSEKVDVHTYG